jgi:hypothetical protein
MLVINKNSNNEWILTLNELATLTNPYYLFKVTSEFKNVTKCFIAASDLSDYPDRFNRFIITESDSEILTSGTVSFEPTGQWLYEVYEQTSSTNLDPASADNTTPLEKGKILVIGTGGVVYKKHSSDIKYKGYGG